MIKRLAVVAVLMALSACQTTSRAETLDDDTSARILDISQNVCVDHLGDGKGMNVAAMKFTGSPAKKHTAKSKGKSIPVSSYRYVEDGKYLGFVSVLWDGEVCSVNFADGLVKPSLFQEKFGVSMVNGVYEGAMYGKASSKEMVVSFTKFKGEDGPVLAVGFLDRDGYDQEKELTGAPDIQWGM